MNTLEAVGWLSALAFLVWMESGIWWFAGGIALGIKLSLMRE